MNASLFKIVFSKRLGMLVAVGEHASSQGKARGNSGQPGAGTSQGAGTFFMGVLGLCFGLTSMAWAQGVASTALPTGGAVSAGAAAISSMGAAMTIQQSSQRAAINWQSFNIGKDASVTVQQPSSSSVLLNRIGGDSPSQILGRMSANGQIVLVNPNGMTFGKDGSVSAAGFTASTLGISDADFMAGNMKFSRDGATGSIVNQGSIQTNGGYVALLGASVSNEGKIETAGGNAYLAAAETVRVPVSGTGRIKLELSPASINAAVANSKEGAIVTQGGQVYMQAAALHTAMASVLQSGSIDTTGAQAGNVTLLAEGGHIQVDGRITANSSQPDQAGGRIVIGRDEDTGALAKSTNVSGATLESQGGFIETSGEQLQVSGVKIQAKDWLLDPNDIVIDSTNPTSGTGLADAQTQNGTSYINTADITAALSSANVTIATSATATGGNGDITVNSAIANTGNKTLTLNATIGLYANVTNTSAIGTVVNGFTDDLRLTDLDATHLQNTRANAAYGAAIAGSTQSTEVYFRERVNLDTTLSGTATYGADLSGSGIRSVLANDNASNTIVKNSAAGTLKANGAAVAAMLDATTLGQSSSFTGQYSSSNNLKANPGTPYVLDTSLSDFTGVQATLLVNKKDASVSATATSKQYNGLTQNQDAATTSGFINGDQIVVSGESSGKNAGTYTSNLQVTGVDASNYNIAITNNDLAITKNTSANVVLTANSDTRQYNGATQSVSGFTVTGLLGDDATNSAATTSGITAGASGKNAGSYATSFSGSNADLANNYQNVSYVNGALDITKNTSANVVLTANSDTKQYNGATQSVSGFTAQGTLTVDDTAAVSAGTSGKNAGRYTTSFSGTDQLEANYAHVQKVNGTLTIAPKEVSLQASKVYDSSRNLTGQQLTISTGVANETLNYSAASLASKDVADNATNHVASVTLTDGSGLASNYTFNPAKGASNQALITPAPLTIAATATQTVYNGKLQQQALPTVRGLLGNDVLTVSGLATGIDPGSYMSSLRWSGLGAENYAVTALNAPLVILNAPALLPSFNRESVKQIDPITRITLLGFRSATTGGATAVLQKLQLTTSAQADSCSATSLERCDCQSGDDAQGPLFCKPIQP